MTSAPPAPITFATHKRVRLGGLFLLYAAQGAPEGLLYVAVPAWLAARGVEAAAIGAYIAVILLPWSLKLINGLLMDRIAFLPMGRRRPWLIVAQAVLVFALLAFGANTPELTVGDEALVYITAVGFLVNLAGAFQDVAIDGMAIDVVPDAERAQANGVMWGGKTLGIAAASFVTGRIIADQGYAAAALVVALFVGAVMLVPLLVRERPGERLLPWTHGAASPESTSRQLHRWAPIAMSLFRVLIRPASLLLAAAIFLALAGYGLDTAYGPILAASDLGWSEADYGDLAGGANLAGGLFGVFLCGWIADRIGPRRALIATLVLMAMLQAAMALAPHAWATPAVFGGYTVVYALLFVLMSVCIYAVAMGVATPSVAATQFSVYMAVLNLGTSFGAQRFGPVHTDFGYSGAFALAAAFALVAAAVFALSGRLAQSAKT